jgi:thioredoxin
MVEQLTKETFLRKVYNYRVYKDWKFEGEKPCVIDFYAEWCGPCKMLEPVLEELAVEYENKINIYRVNTGKESELASVSGIWSIPSILFVPKDKKPQMAKGPMPKDALIRVIRDLLEVEK